MFAETLDAKTRNIDASYFSFNNELGRCSVCEGNGQLQVDMQFLADVTMVCPTCKGARFRDEILRIRYRDLSIADVLAMSARQAQAFFRGHDQVQSRLQRLTSMWVWTMFLGQPATTLSSGEAQRLKLAAFLAGRGESARCSSLMNRPRACTCRHRATLRLL